MRHSGWGQRMTMSTIACSGIPPGPTLPQPETMLFAKSMRIGVHAPSLIEVKGVENHRDCDQRHGKDCQHYLRTSFASKRSQGETKNAAEQSLRCSIDPQEIRFSFGQFRGRASRKQPRPQ